MPVTEFAFLELAVPATPLPDSIRDTLAKATSVQDAWHAAAFPWLPSSAVDRAAFWFYQVNDPSWLMTTAKWDSVGAHWEWIRSEENKGIMNHLAKEGVIIPESSVLFHVGGEIFDGTINVKLQESPVISVERLFVPPSQRPWFETKFMEVKGILETYASPDLVRFGWRGDVEGGPEEFVLVCGWESVERHLRFAEMGEYARYDEIHRVLERRDLKHYGRISLE
ncbi:hypothetical protein VTH82DRAFT_5054 [Thermothelomyces myriococcoides]